MKSLLIPQPIEYWFPPEENKLPFSQPNELKKVVDPNPYYTLSLSKKSNRHIISFFRESENISKPKMSEVQELGELAYDKKHGDMYDAEFAELTSQYIPDLTKERKKRSNHNPTTLTSKAAQEIKDRCATIPTEEAYFLTLTYAENMKDGRKAKSDLNRFLTHMKYYFKKRRQTFRYVWAMEKQKRGAAHFHFCMNSYVPVEEIRKAWKHGRNNIQKVKYSVVSYMAKYLSKGDKDESFALGGRLWGCDRETSRLARKERVYTISMQLRLNHFYRISQAIVNEGIKYVNDYVQQRVFYDFDTEHMKEIFDKIVETIPKIRNLSIFATWKQKLRITNETLSHCEH